METTGVGIPEAVERLANMAGVPLPVEFPEAAAAEKRRATTFEALELATFFEAQLHSPGGQKPGPISPSEALSKRGKTKATTTPLVTTQPLVERNRAVALRVFDELFNQRRPEVAGEIYSPNFRNHGLHGDASLEVDQGWARGELQAFPDLHMTVVDADVTASLTVRVGVADRRLAVDRRCVAWRRGGGVVVVARRGEAWW